MDALKASSGSVVQAKKILLAKNGTLENTALKEYGDEEGAKGNFGHCESIDTLDARNSLSGSVVQVEKILLAKSCTVENPALKEYIDEEGAKEGKVLDATIIQEAKKLKLIDKLKTLASIANFGHCEAIDILDALKASSGSVPQAKKILLAKSCTVEHTALKEYGDEEGAKEGKVLDATIVQEAKKLKLVDKLKKLASMPNFGHCEASDIMD